MKRANKHKIMKDSSEIARRLRQGQATVTALMKEYHCAHGLLIEAVMTQMSMDEWLQIAKRNLAAGGVNHRFKKGHKTWNKGQKGISYPGSKATQFKKGSIRGNAARKYRPVGSITVRNYKRGNQYRYIKIKDDGPPQKRCIPLATYRWQQANGPVPEGMFVVHRDGDTLNDDPSNLIAVDRSGHPRLQQSRDPGIVVRMRKGTAIANKSRSTNNKRIASLKAAWAKRKAKASQQVIWECLTCGGEFLQEDQPSRCPKCGSLVIARKHDRLEYVG